MRKDVSPALSSVETWEVERGERQAHQLGSVHRAPPLTGQGPSRAPGWVEKALNPQGRMARNGNARAWGTETARMPVGRCTRCIPLVRMWAKHLGSNQQGYKSLSGLRSLLLGGGCSKHKRPVRLTPIRSPCNGIAYRRAPLRDLEEVINRLHSAGTSSKTIHARK